MPIFACRPAVDAELLPGGGRQVHREVEFAETSGSVDPCGDRYLEVAEQRHRVLHQRLLGGRLRRPGQRTAEVDRRHVSRRVDTPERFMAVDADVVGNSLQVVRVARRVGHRRGLGLAVERLARPLTVPVFVRVRNPIDDAQFERLVIVVRVTGLRLRGEVQLLVRQVDEPRAVERERVVGTDVERHVHRDACGPLGRRVLHRREQTRLRRRWCRRLGRLAALRCGMRRGRRELLTAAAGNREHRNQHHTGERERSLRRHPSDIGFHRSAP